MSTGELRVHAYGKLPISREFLSYPPADRATRLFADFLHGAARPLTELPADAAPLRICAPLPDRRSFFVASVWPSSDEGGLRPFPFSLFVRVDATETNGSGVSRASGAIHADLARAYEELGACEDARAFERCIESTWATVPNAFVTPPPAENGAQSTPDWLDSVFGDSPDHQVHSLWRLRNAVHAARGDLTRLADRYAGLRFPVRSNEDADPWLAMVARLGAIRFPVGLLNGPVGPAHASAVCIMIRPLEPNHLAVVADPHAKGILDFAAAKEPANLAGIDAFRATIEERLEGSHAELARFPELLDGL